MIDMAAMSDLDDQYPKYLILDFANDAVVADPISSVGIEFWPLQCFADSTEILLRRDA